MHTYPVTYNANSFKKQQSTKSSQIVKRAYIESKTGKLDQLCDVFCLAALGTGFLNTDEIGKIKKPNKWCKGFIITGIVLCAINWIKLIQLSKQYDKETNK